MQYPKKIILGPEVHESVTWREVCEADLLTCLQIEPRHIGDELVGRAQAIETWRTIVRQRSFNSIVIEAESECGRRPIAFGASVFVTSDFADRELLHGRPGLNSRLIASMSSRKSAVLADDTLANAGARNSVDVVILCGSWLQHGISADQLRKVQMLLPFTFIECHVGYPLHRIFNETVTQIQRDFQFSSGVYQLIGECSKDDRVFQVMTEGSARAVSGSMAIKLFQYRDPVLNLRDTEKQLLSEALNGRNDEQIAETIHITVASVKKRWESVFDRFEGKFPELLTKTEKSNLLNHRGSQKRHHVISYVRAHPQELRPYRWKAQIEL